MEEPKAEVSAILIQLDGVSTYQERPEVIENRPCVTYAIADNRPEYSLDKDVANQNVEVDVDIWGDNSAETGSILKDLERLMIAGGYRCSFAQDIPDPDGGSHIATRFIK